MKTERQGRTEKGCPAVLHPLGCLPQHPTDHLILLVRRVPGHPGASGDGLTTGHIGAELHIHPDLLSGVGVDTFGVLGAVWPGGGVTAREQMVIDLGTTPGARLSLSPQHRLEVFD